jgi:hypothetical protein
MVTAPPEDGEMILPNSDNSADWRASCTPASRELLTMDNDGHVCFSRLSSLRAVLFRDAFLLGLWRFFSFSQRQITSRTPRILIKADHRFFSVTERDLSMAGGCADCLGPCKIALLKLSLFSGQALASSPMFNALASLPPTEAIYIFSSLGGEILDFAQTWDANDAICFSGTDEWGSTASSVWGTPQQILATINTLKASV